VHRYKRGKADWIVRGLPSEPRLPPDQRLRAAPFFVDNLAPQIRRAWIKLSRRQGAVTRVSPDLPRLGPEQLLPDLSDVNVAPLAVVLDAAGVLLGSVDENRPGAPVAGIINPAPQTIRPDMTHRLAAHLLRHSPYLLVSDADGHYLGRYIP
jgi:hypothetical protein